MKRTKFTERLIFNILKDEAYPILRRERSKFCVRLI